MLRVNLYDSNFAHSIGEDGFDTCSAGREPTKLKWVRGNSVWEGVTVFTDHLIATDTPDIVQSTYKVAWIVEPKAIHPWAYDQMPSLEDKFDAILTHDADLLDRGPKYHRISIGSLRVKDEDQRIYKKTKNISIIASHKRDTEGHLLRHELIKMCPELDAWGSGYKRFDSKLDPLQDYMFSVAVMNSRVDNYFTEILTDCFAVGTVPIFWGTPNIDEFFNSAGIIEFTDLKEFSEIKLSAELYHNMLPAIKDNFNQVMNYKSTDDIIALKLKEIFKL